MFMQEQAETKMQQWGQQESQVADYKMSVNQLHCVVCREWLLPGLHQSPVLASLLNTEESCGKAEDNLEKGKRSEKRPRELWQGIWVVQPKERNSVYGVFEEYSSLKAHKCQLPGGIQYCLGPDEQGIS